MQIPCLVRRFVLIASITTACVSTQIQRQPSADVNQGIYRSDYFQAITDILEKRVFSLDRQMITFRYEGGDARLESLAQVRARFENQPQKFFDVSEKDGNAVGPGIYTAIDPVVTRSFGSTTPQLYVFPLAKGIRVLNLFDPAEGVNFDKVKTILDDMKCRPDLSSSLGDLSEVLFRFRDSDVVACRQLIIDALARANIQAIMYGYSAAFRLKSCRSGHQVAFNIVSPEAIDYKNLAFFSDTKQFGGNPIQNGSIYRLYQEAMQDYQIQASASKDDDLRIPSRLQPGSIPLFFSNHWIGLRIGRCGKLWSFEGTPNNVDKLVNFGVERRGDPEVKSLLVEARREFYSLNKFDSEMKVTGNFDPGRIREIETLMYHESAMTTDDSKLADFLKAKDILTNYDLKEEERLRQASELLLESQPKTKIEDQSALDKIATQALNSPATNSNILWELFSDLGYGRRMSLISVNNILLQFGVVPYLVSPPPVRSSLASTLGGDAAEIKKLLRKCIDLYREAKSLEEIQAGTCGVRSSLKNGGATESELNR